MQMEIQNGPNARIRPQAVILAGGRSSRFGSDKAMAKFKGREMLRMVASALEQASFRVCISTSHKAHQSLGYPIIWDTNQFYGPLWALAHVLEVTQAHKVLLTACDTPLLTPNITRMLWSKSSGFDIAVCIDKAGVPQLLPGIYSRTVLVTVQENLQKGQNSLKGLLRSHLKIKKISARIWGAYDKNGQAFTNINSKQDLADLLLNGS